MKNWVEIRKGADFQKISEQYNISPVLARLMRNRDITEDEEIELYLNGTASGLIDGSKMKDVPQAAEILVQKIREQKKIRVIGDYDIDGVNATYILKEGLSRLGADVDTDIPDRIKDGYGLNRMLIDRALADQVDTIITCDNGIAAYDEIAYGKESGMTIIVTDHHQVPFVEEEREKKYRIPPADAVVDPQQADCMYPFKGLCGAAVAYKLMEVLWRTMGKDPASIHDLMENVAMATVGDVMDLQGENRIFVKTGLEMMKHTSNHGLAALMECTGIDVERLSAYHIGFVIGPCINAGGRLDTAKRALELLSAGTRREAVMLAADLKALNEERKALTEQALDEAVDRIEHSSLKEDKVLVVYLPDCHESIAGIVAGKIRERYYRPTFVLTDAQEGVKGSGRSIDAYHMYEEMNRCSDLFTKFGGHKLAAGLSLERDHVEVFRRRINELATLTEEDLTEKLEIDMRLPFSYITEQLVEELQRLEPFGKGNGKPVFAQSGLKVTRPRIIGKNKNALKCWLEDASGKQMEALYFGDVQKCLDEMCRKQTIAVTFYPSVNEYMGKRTVQIVIGDYR